MRGVLFSIIVFVVIISFSAPYLIKMFYAERSFLFSKKPQNTIFINNHPISIELAATNEEKAIGLSGRKKLATDSGMLFIFKNKTRPSFWMKDMVIPIDIIWITEEKIVKVDENLQPPKPNTPDSSLILYTPPEGIDYVLEVNAGFSQKNHIKIGDSVSINF